MTETTIAEKLRAPFPPEQIGKLPRVTCGDCSDKRKPCDKHQKGKCSVCNGWVSTQHIHLDYVGHADVTSRLLEADPEWDWEPQARDIDPAVLAAAIATGNPDMVKLVIKSAPPKFDLDERGNPVGLWINLTAGGTTRPGYGSCPSGQNDAVKVLIGDALRNAAMRFGVALDLWAKGDRADPSAENATASGGQVQRRNGRQEDWDSATPARGANGNGHVSRPAQENAPAADSTDLGEVDEAAQAIADEAHLCRTMTGISGLHKQAHEGGKLSAVVASPSTGNKGKLGPYLNWRRQQIQAESKALEELNAAGNAAGLDAGGLDGFVQMVTGKNLEDASLADLKTCIAKMSETARASS